MANPKPRKPPIKNRTQFFNPLIGRFIKRDSESGRILNVKDDGRPFKRVRREK